MTTTTSATSSTSASTAATTAAATTATTAAKTASGVVTSAANSILTSLNTGSGVDTDTLVSSLVDAEFSTQTSALQTKYDTLTTQLSGVSTLKSTITSFASALKSLVTGGTLQTQPSSSNSSAVGVSAIAGTVISNLSSTISVSQLADRQSAVSATAFPSSSAVVGTGKLTLTLGTATYGSDGRMATFTGTGGDGNGDGVDDKAITINVTDGKLSSIASAINGANAGVTASIITDADGSAYLTLKGATGAAQAFTLTSQSDSGDLSALNVGVGSTSTRLTSTAQDAKLTVDGVPVSRSSNTISDLVAGVKLQLNQTTSSPVSLSSTTPTDALSSAVSDFVDTYNEVLSVVTEQTDPVNGALRSDPAAKALLASLKSMTLSQLLTGGATGSPSTLSQIGVKTNQDGTLAVDSATLTKALASSPESVEAMFTDTGDGKTGLSALLSSLSDEATNTTYGLGASSTTYTNAQSDVSEQQSELSDKRTDETTRLTQQFATMNTKVASYKSIQSYLTQQIDAWNKSDN